MKRALILTVAGLCAVATLAATAAGASQLVSKRSVTLHLVEKSVGFNYIDNPPRQGPNMPPLMGDEFAITSNLQTKSGQHVGTLEAMCMVTRGGDHTRGPCYGVFALEGGQIAGIALLTSGNVTHVAIVGGTGAYEGVTGSIVSVGRGENSPFSDDTIHLVWP